MCDGRLFANKDVAVIGSGNTAVGEALHLSQFCNHVYIVIRKNEFKASEYLIKKLLSKPNITVLKNYTINSFSGIDVLNSAELKSSP